MIGKIKNLFKQYKLLVVVIILGLVFVSVVFLLRSRSIGTKDPQITYTNLGNQDQSIRPGVDTKESVEKTLGKPSKEQTQNNLTVLNYTPKIQTGNWSNQIYIDSNSKVILVIELLPTNVTYTRDNITPKIGKESFKLYGGDAPIFALYSYPDKGIAFLSSTNPEIVSEVWHFQVMSESEFKDFAKTFGYLDQMPQNILD